MKLERDVLSNLEELNKVGLGIVKPEEFLEGVSEIKREQTYLDGKWETDCYKFLTTTGGPNIIIDGCKEVVEGIWGKEREIVEFSESAKEGYRRIVEYLKETLGE